MTVQRDPDDPERIGPVRHLDDCDCDTCSACPGCGEPIPRNWECCDACDQQRREEQQLEERRRAL